MEVKIAINKGVSGLWLAVESDSLHMAESYVGMWFCDILRSSRVSISRLPRTSPRMLPDSEWGLDMHPPRPMHEPADMGPGHRKKSGP